MSQTHAYANRMPLRMLRRILARRWLTPPGPVIGALVAGCLSITAPASEVPSPMPSRVETTFAAHREHGGLVIDHVRGAGNADVVVCESWSGTRPHVEADGKMLMLALRPLGPGEVDVRARCCTEAPTTGRVEPRWEDNAIRLALRTDALSLETGLFERVDSGRPGRLSRAVEMAISLRGTYEALLRDADGKSVGWLRVQVERCGARRYEGVFPEAVAPGLAAATALALDTELDWIEAHSLDAYSGS